MQGLLVEAHSIVAVSTAIEQFGVIWVNQHGLSEDIDGIFVLSLMEVTDSKVSEVFRAAWLYVGGLEEIFCSLPELLHR